MATPRLQVLQLGPYPPPNGGVQTNLVAIRDYLRARGIPCRVINLTGFRRTDQDGVFYPESALQTLKLILRLPRTVIHLHIGGDLTPRLLALGLICNLLPGSRTVLTLHSGGYPTSKAGETARPYGFAAFVFRRFDRLIGVNTALVDHFIRRFGASPRRVRKIMPYSLPAGVPAVDIPPAIEEFFSTHRPVLISMGWLEPEYDFQLQIRALALVRERFPNAGLLLLGAGRLRDDLQRQAERSSCKAHVLMPGDVPHELALAAIARSDIFLRTTLYDGDSISVREALHYGTPVIASDNGLRPSGVHLIPKENEAALVNAIHEIAGAGRQAGTTGSANDENIHAVYELYREIAGISSAD
jgi:glycosyltransferase involved in cell wall biosynthesis